MRPNIKSAKASFIPTTFGRLHDPKQVAELWRIVEAVTDTPVEFVSRHWVLESADELVEEFTDGDWAFDVKYGALNGYARIEAEGARLHFFGSASAESHQTLSRLGEALAPLGFQRVDSYTDAVRAAERIERSERKGTRALQSASWMERLAGAAEGNIDALRTSGRYGWEALRNGILLSVVWASLFGVDRLRPAVLASVIATAGLTLIVFSLETAQHRRTR